MEEQKVVKESVRNEAGWTVTPVLPQGSETGFFLVRKVDDKPFREPVMARKIIIETMDGTIDEITVNRTPPDDTLQGEMQLEYLVRTSLEKHVIETVLKLCEGQAAPVELSYRQVAEAAGGIKGRTVGDILRSAGIPTKRKDDGWYAALDEEKLVELCLDWHSEAIGRDAVDEHIGDGQGQAG